MMSSNAQGCPIPKPRDPIMDFHEMIEFVEQKYGIRTRDYNGLHGPDSHCAKWQREAGDPQPNDGHYPDCSGDGETAAERLTVVRDGKRRKATQGEYDADFKLIHEHFQRYQDWCETNPAPAYLDYWHWLLGDQFSDVHNPCTQTWDLRVILEDDDTPDWVRGITQKVHDEFEHVLIDGAVEVLIEW